MLPGCWWRLSCLAHTCLMTGLPMCWINTPPSCTSGDQCSTPICGQISVLSLWKDIYYIYKNWKEVCLGRNSNKLRRCSMRDWRKTFLAAKVWAFSFISFFFLSVQKGSVKTNSRKNRFFLCQQALKDMRAYPSCSSLVVFPAASGWHLRLWGPWSRRTRWPL